MCCALQYAKGSVDTKQTGRSAGADRFYIQAKLGRLRRHAQQILQELSDKHAELEQAGDLDARQHKQHMDGITFAKRVSTDRFRHRASEACLRHLST